MQVKASLALLVISLLTLRAQIAPNRPDSVAPASAIDFQTVPVPVNSVVSIAMTLDPSAGGGDVVDVLLGDPGLQVSIVLPSGTELNSGNAARRMLWRHVDD